ncbi:MAG: hypothetical protein HOP16_05135 [Acidobacteria bacterium]|nr:hypothetical protein [Acidobacteriota bacterium]
MKQDDVNLNERDVRDALRALARAEEHLAARPHVEAAVMRAWDASAAASIGPRRGSQARALWAVAASFLLAVGASYVWVRSDVPVVATQSTDAGVAVGSSWPSDEALVWLDPDPASLQIVRLRVASATLSAQGYPVSDPDGDGTVDIEMIVGADGLARSVRVTASATQMN